MIAVEDQLVAEDKRDELLALEGTIRVFPFDLRETLGPASDDKLYVNFPRQYSPWPKFSFDLRQRAFWGGTVSFLNLQLAAHLGCSPLYLVGFDHNYSVPPSVGAGHTTAKSDGPDVNHFHPDYVKPGVKWNDPQLDRMELAYACAKRELSRKGIPVYNATAGGKLEVFQRMEFDAIAPA